MRSHGIIIWLFVTLIGLSTGRHKKGSKIKEDVFVGWQYTKVKKSKQGSTKHQRFVFHHPPVHCSWMNQVEKWFSILQRKRLKISDFGDKKALIERLQTFISEWNTKAHLFGWSEKSTLKIIAKCQISDSNSTSQIDLAIAA